MVVSETFVGPYRSENLRQTLFIHSFWNSTFGIQQIQDVLWYSVALSLGFRVDFSFASLDEELVVAGEDIASSISNGLWRLWHMTANTR